MISRKLLQSKGAVNASSLFKGFVFFGIIIVAALFTIYTQFIIDQLEDNIKRDVRMWAKLWELAGAEDSSPRLNAVVFEEIIQKAYFPIIVVDRNKDPILWARIGNVADNDTTSAGFQKIIKHAGRMETENGATPVSWNGQVIQYILYDYPPLIQQLQIMPFVQIFVVAVFIIVGFFGFSNIQRAEQNKIWVGMAKETAHQLGTPISSLMGWVEVMDHDLQEGSLASTEDASESISNIINRLRVDINRLEKVADRFEQIGSIPETSRKDINKIVEGVVKYFQQRVPYGGKGISINFKPAENIYAKINPDLFSWVIENMIINSMQACDSRTGRIIVSTTRSKDNKYSVIRVTDNGKGINPKNAKKIFDAGFSTKKRGWGLGLPLAKRIIKDYHRGRIELCESMPGESTTFQITLLYEQDNN